MTITGHDLNMVSLYLDACALVTSLGSIVAQLIAGRRLDRAIKDLHESHDELHKFLKEIE